MDEVIRTQKLSKAFRDVLAVSEISLNVRKGEIYGFLGLNGAGKTTTIRMLLGMIHPTSGEAFINGRKIHHGNMDIWKDVGYLVEIPYSYPDLTVRENLEIARRLRSLPMTAIDSVMNRLQISQYAERKARNLSLGNAQRLGLAKALIHNPSILLLDEPANGLDPAGIIEIRGLLTSLSREQGTTVFISSHILTEISRFATRIGIIHNGVLRQEINTLQLELLCRKRLVINTLNNNKAKLVLEKAGIPAAENGKNMLEVENEDSIRHPETIASLLAENQVAPALLHVVEEDLESYFLRTITD
jgi:ABC-2 type transport system ATP-binding protein